MFGSDDDVAHAGFLGEGHPLIGIEFDGIKLFGVGLVAGHGDLAFMHDPFADPGDGLAVIGAGGHGINAPVDEHAEAGVAPPAHAGVAFRGGFVGVGIGRYRGIVGRAERGRSKQRGGQEGQCEGAEQVELHPLFLPASRPFVQRG